jgi:hypothetical protein
MEPTMKTNHELSHWIASIERGDCGYTYIRLFRDAPGWVRNATVNRYGKGTVFLPPTAARNPVSQAA